MEFPPASEPLAQAVEHLPFKQRVAGSNPARLTRFFGYLQRLSVKKQRIHRFLYRVRSVNWIASELADFDFLVRAQVVLQPLLSFPEFALVHDPITAIHARGFVASDLHGDLLPNSGPRKISRGAPS